MSGEPPIFIEELRIDTLVAASLATTALSVTDTTNATSPTTGSLKTAGGAGVALDAWLGGSLFLPTGSVTLSAGTLLAAAMSAVTVLATGIANATSAVTGSLRTAGGLAVALNVWVAGSVRAVAGMLTSTVNTGAASPLNLVTNNSTRLAVPANGFATDYTATTSLVLNGSTIRSRDDGIFITSAVVGVPAGVPGPTTSFLTLNGSNLLRIRSDIDTESSFGYSWTTGFTATQSATINYVKVGSFVSLKIGVVSGTTPAVAPAAITTDVGALPADLRPAVDFIWYVPEIIDDGSIDLRKGEIVVGANGRLTWFRTSAGLGFPASATVTINGPWMVSYNRL